MISPLISISRHHRRHSHRRSRSGSRSPHKRYITDPTSPPAGQSFSAGIAARTGPIATLEIADEGGLALVPGNDAGDHVLTPRNDVDDHAPIPGRGREGHLPVATVDTTRNLPLLVARVPPHGPSHWDLQPKGHHPMLSLLQWREIDVL